MEEMDDKRSISKGQDEETKELEAWLSGRMLIVTEADRRLTARIQSSVEKGMALSLWISTGDNPPGALCELSMIVASERLRSQLQARLEEVKAMQAKVARHAGSDLLNFSLEVLRARLVEISAELSKL